MRSGLSRLFTAFTHYRDACNALRTPVSAQSRRGLDWMNFFIADVQAGFGAFVAFYLAQQGWSPKDVGVALGVGAAAGVLSQIPGGALADAVRWKRALVAAGIVMIGCAALILAVMPSFIPVLVAEILHGTTSGIVTPAIGAISLGLVGHHAIAHRAGRNYRYAAAGNALTAGIMGLAGHYWQSGIFVTSALLCIPALISLAMIHGDEIDYARARNAAKRKEGYDIGRVLDLAKNRPLVLFAAALVLFHLANASVLPLVGQDLAKTGQQGASIWM